jgi:hypothetical protein
MEFTDEPVRPFFLAANLDWETIPTEVKAGIEHIVLPIYQRYVLEGIHPLDVAAGSSLAFLMAQEVLAQYQITGRTFRDLQPSPSEAAERQKMIDEYLRLLGAKGRCANFLQRLAEFRMQKSYDYILD